MKVILSRIVSLKMASVVSGPQELLEPARKRQKLSPPLSQHLAQVANYAVINTMSEAQKIAHDAMMSQRDREAQAGILCFVNESNPGFSGILKQRYLGHVICTYCRLMVVYRYTDFLVNEVKLDGKVVHLTELNVPRRKPTPKVSLEI